VKRRNTSSFAICLLTQIAAPSAIYGQSLDGRQATAVSNAIQLTVSSTGTAASPF
jgi:hypothetical protein